MTSSISMAGMSSKPGVSLSTSAGTGLDWIDLNGCPAPVANQMPESHLGCRVFVANVPVEAVERLQLHARFSKYGIVTEVIIHRKGFAFVQFKKPEDALAAIKGEHGSSIKGHKIGCSMTKHVNKAGLSRHPHPDGKQFVIGDPTGNEDDKDVTKAPVTRVHAGGDCPVMTQRSRECDWDKEVQETVLPSPNLPSLNLPSDKSDHKEDHSLTLGLFMKKQKPGAKKKLVPFKKTTPKKNQAPLSRSTNEGAVEGGSSSKFQRLQSKLFNSFKFKSDTSQSSVVASPEDGPFQELWDLQDVSRDTSVGLPEFDEDEDLVPKGMASRSLDSSLQCNNSNNSLDGDQEDVLWEDELLVDNPAQTKPDLSGDNDLGNGKSNLSRNPTEVVGPNETLQDSKDKVGVSQDETDACAQGSTAAQGVIETPVGLGLQQEVVIPVEVSPTVQGDQLGSDCNLGTSSSSLVLPQNAADIQDEGKNLVKIVDVNKQVIATDLHIEPCNKKNSEESSDLKKFICHETSEPTNTSQQTNPTSSVLPNGAICPPQTVNTPRSLSSAKATTKPLASTDRVTSSVPINQQSVHPTTTKSCAGSSNNSIQASVTHLADAPASHPRTAATSISSVKTYPLLQQSDSVRVGSNLVKQPLSPSAVPFTFDITADTKLTPVHSTCSPAYHVQPSSQSNSMGPIGVPPPPMPQVQQQIGQPQTAQQMAHPIGPPPSSQSSQRSGGVYHMVPVQPVMTPVQPVMTPVQPVMTPVQPVMTPVQPLMSQRVQQTLTYGSLYPSRPVSAPVTGYMSYQSRFQQQNRPPTPPVVPAGQQGPNFNEPPPQFGQQHRDRHSSGQSTPSPSYTPPLMGSYGMVANQPGQPAAAGNQQVSFNQQPAVSYQQQQQVPVSYQQPVGYQQQQHSGQQQQQTYGSAGAYQSSNQYGSSMKNLTMSASVPLERQLGYRDSSFPLTDIEKSKINSEFKQALQEIGGGPVEVTDNNMLRVFMVLPEPIRRGIKRLGGLKAYLQQSGAFEIKGDMVALYGQMKGDIKSPPGSYQPRSSPSYLSGEASVFVPGSPSREGQRSSSTGSGSGSLQRNRWSSGPSQEGRRSSSTVSSTSSQRGQWPSSTGSSGSSQGGQRSSSTLRQQSQSTTSSSSWTSIKPPAVVRSRHESCPHSTSQSLASTSRRASTSDASKETLIVKGPYSRDSYNPDDPYDSYHPQLDTEAPSTDNSDVDVENTEDTDVEDTTVYKLVKDTPRTTGTDDLWELDSFLTEAYGGGYYQDYLALSKELEEKKKTTSQEIAAKDKMQLHKENKPPPADKIQDSMKPTGSVATSTDKWASIRPDSSKWTASSHAKDQRHVVATSCNVEDSRKIDAIEQNIADHVKTAGSMAENACKANVIDPKAFHRTASTTFAAKLLEAATKHTESTSERTDGTTGLDVGSCDSSGVGAETMKEDSERAKMSENEPSAASNNNAMRTSAYESYSSDFGSAREKLIKEECNILTPSEIGTGPSKVVDAKECVVKEEAEISEEWESIKPDIDNKSNQKEDDAESVGSWCTLSDEDSPQRLTKTEIVDKFLATEMIDVMAQVDKKHAKEWNEMLDTIHKQSNVYAGKEYSKDLSKAEIIDVEDSTVDSKAGSRDIAITDSTSTGSNVAAAHISVKANRSKCAAVFNTSESEEDAGQDKKKPMTVTQDDLANQEKFEVDVKTETQVGPSPDEVLVTDDIDKNPVTESQDDLAEQEMLEEETLKHAVLFTDEVTDDVDKKPITESQDDLTKPEKLEVDTEKQAVLSSDDTPENVLPIKDEDSLREETNEEGCSNTASLDEELVTGANHVETTDIGDQPDQLEVQEEQIVQSKVSLPSAMEAFFHVETASVAINTDVVKMIHKGVVTSKVSRVSRVTNTVAVPTVTRGVGTFEEFEESYRLKNVELERHIRLLEDSLETERDQNTILKHNVQMELRGLREKVQSMEDQKNELEDQLKIKKRQQTVEMKKTSAELRDTSARYSAQKIKVQSLEKENSCSIARKLSAVTLTLKLFELQNTAEAGPSTHERTSMIGADAATYTADLEEGPMKTHDAREERETAIITRELSAVTRELFDLQNAVEAGVSQERTPMIISTHAGTSTADLEEGQRKRHDAREERAKAMYERARDAELQVLKMQLEGCQQTIHKTQQQGQYTYSVFANSPQMSTHEKLYVNSQWASYQSMVQEAIQKLLKDYECNKSMLEDTGKSLADLPPLRVPNLDAFTPRTGMPSSTQLPFTATDTGFLAGDDASSSCSNLNTAASETVSDAGLDELKSMSTRLLQPDLDLAKPPLPNLAGSTPLFSLGSLLSQQQPNVGVRHPYNRESREARLRSIQRRLGLNPDTGKRLAPPSQRIQTPSAAGSSELDASESESAKQMIDGTTAASQHGGDAHSFAMKQRSLSTSYRPRVQSTPSENSNPVAMSTGVVPTAGGQSMPSPAASLPPSDDVSTTRARVARALTRRRSMSSPVQSEENQNEKTKQLETKQFLETRELSETAKHVLEMDREITETTRHLPETTRHLPETARDVSETARDVLETARDVSETARDVSKTTNNPEDSLHQQKLQSQNSQFGSQEETYPTSHYMPPEPASHNMGTESLSHYQANTEPAASNHPFEEPLAASSLSPEQLKQESPFGTKESNLMPSDDYADPNVAGTTPLEFSFRKAYSTEGPAQAEYTSLSLGTEAAAPMGDFPKSDAIKAARSISPTEQLEETWGNLPSKLKAKLAPRMTRSGRVKLTALEKTQKLEEPSAGSKVGWGGKSATAAASGKRKGSTQKEVVGPAASALAPIDDVEDGGWTTVIGKKKKKGLDIVEQQQQQASSGPKSPPKPAHSGGSLDKIHSALARQFPGITKQEVMETMKQVRINHRGSLSGVSMAIIVKEASSHIKNTSLKYMVPKPEPAKERRYTYKRYGCEGFCILDEEFDDMCVICQDELRALPGGSGRGIGSKNSKIRMLECGHMFHEECIQVWYINRESSCPICRCHTLIPEDFPALAPHNFSAYD